jgi:hypothetical protein
MPFFDYDEVKWLVQANSPTRFQEANIKGYEEGYELIRNGSSPSRVHEIMPKKLFNPL